MVDFDPGDPPQPEEAAPFEEFERIAEQQCDRMDSAGRYVAEFKISDTNSQERLDNLLEFDTESAVIETRDGDEYLVFSKADPTEFVYGIEIIGETLAGV